MAVESTSAAWLKTQDAEEWLRTATLEELVGRQAFLVFHNGPVTPAAYAEYDIIEAAIRGETVEELRAERARFDALSAQLDAEIAAGTIDPQDRHQWWREHWEALS